MAPTAVIKIRNSGLNGIGQLDAYESAQIVPMFNDVGAFTVTVSADSPQAALLVPGNGLIINWNGVRIMSGDIQDPAWAESASDGGAGTLTIAGADDNIVLADATVYPDPGSPLTAQTDATYVINAPAETAMYALVNLNCGPGALAERQIAGLVMGTDLGRGPTVTRQVNQFVPLVEVLQDLATLSGLGFRVLQTAPGTRTFEVYAPRDLTQTAVFAFGKGNLVSANYSTTPPTCTCAIVVAGGSSSPRVCKEYTQADFYDADLRVEQFVDLTSVDSSDVDLAAQMQTAATTALLNGARQTSLAITPIDIPELRYGADYTVGDIATVQVNSGVVSSNVQQVTLTSDTDNGDVANALVGTPNAATTDPTQPNSALIAALVRINQRVRALETRIQR